MTPPNEGKVSKLVHIEIRSDGRPSILEVEPGVKLMDVSKTLGQLSAGIRALLAQRPGAEFTVIGMQGGEFFHEEKP
jgi:hypothetical protein